MCNMSDDNHSNGEVLRLPPLRLDRLSGRARDLVLAVAGAHDESPEAAMVRILDHQAAVDMATAQPASGAFTAAAVAGVR